MQLIARAATFSFLCFLQIPLILELGWFVQSKVSKLVEIKNSQIHPGFNSVPYFPTSPFPVEMAFEKNIYR
jgi:hypothetical protein